MNFQQLRAVRETVRQNLNLTEAAARLFTSQPGVSKQIREFEDELGVTIFVRRGKRFVALTDPGRAIVQVIERVLLEADNLKRVATNFSAADEGELRIATTHTQARYSLPEVVTEFKRRYPKVHLSLHQGNPSQVAAWVLQGEADVGIATEALDNYAGLAALPGYTWTHTIVAPHAHPLFTERAITLEALARYPIVTYDAAFTGRTHIDAAFAARELEPDVVIAAIDADVIKTYVELGIGVGIIASMAYDVERDKALKAVDARHLFPVNTTRVAVRRGGFLADFMYDFIERFASPLTRKVVNQALAGDAESYEL
ncbi:MAG: CysB family HTH-type transcriptional regulator [Burkholderiales bacterium]